MQSVSHAGNMQSLCMVSVACLSRSVYEVKRTSHVIPVVALVGGTVVGGTVVGGTVLGVVTLMNTLLE